MNRLRNVKNANWLAIVLLVNSVCMAQKATTAQPGPCTEPKLTSPGPELKPADTPKDTADLPSVVQTVEQALKCYQALSQGKDETQPKGLPKLSSAVMDFKTTTSKTAGFTFAIFVFKVGASREKDVTDDLQFKYSVPKPPPALGANFAKPTPVPLYDELVKEVASAARAAQAQATALGMPLTQVQVTVAYGIKFDGNISVNVPVQLVTIGGNGDYNKNNTQTITLIFGQ